MEKKREIKFRAWEYNNKTKGYEMNNSPLLYDGECFAEWSQVDLNRALNRGGVADSDIENKSIFMQYTGLKDKNGKDIFEGDILTFYDNGNVYIVQYDEDNAEFNCGNEYDKPLAKQCEEGLEVIGNIYENPELIKENN